MTSNVGGELFGRAGLGFSAKPSPETRQKDLRAQLQGVFRPEFINRLSRLICFRPLTSRVVAEIARREVAALKERLGLKRRAIDLVVAEDVLKHVVEKGYNPKYGARAMQRAVEDLVVTPVAELLGRSPVTGRARIAVTLRQCTVTARWADHSAP